MCMPGSCVKDRWANISVIVLALRVTNSSELFALSSTWDFRSHWARLGTPALSFYRCAAPAKLPTWPRLERGSPQVTGTSGLKPKMVLICGDLETQGKRIARPQREPTNTSPVSFNKQKNDQSSGISRPLHTQLPPMLHLWCSFTRSD